ncbi:MAG: hypothetical protein J0I99_17885 [Devosia sp.]|nr:hypothetical protein [Devosia sp.]MBN9308217.1 hypothetical protein [Devosia sp.]MBN9317617.1 hypothetical protein [Devosia sp.]
MKMRELFKRRREPSAGKPRTRDWSVDFTPRDWADLPIHHPRRDDDAA